MECKEPPADRAARTRSRPTPMPRVAPRHTALRVRKLSLVGDHTIERIVTMMKEKYASSTDLAQRITGVHYCIDFRTNQPTALDRRNRRRHLGMGLNSSPCLSSFLGHPSYPGASTNSRAALSQHPLGSRIYRRHLIVRLPCISHFRSVGDLLDQRAR